MRYICLFYFDRALVGAASKAEWAEIDRHSMASNAALKASGHYVASNGLAEPETAVTVRSRGGKVSMTDGPFAETKEHLGGFLLIEAQDMDEALAIARADPLAAMGSIEVRATAGF